MLPATSAKALATSSNKDERFVDIVLDSLKNDLSSWDHRRQTYSSGPRDTFINNQITVYIRNESLLGWIFMGIITLGVATYAIPMVKVTFKDRPIRLRGYEKWKVRFWYNTWRRGLDSNTLSQAREALKEKS